MNSRRAKKKKGGAGIAVVVVILVVVLCVALYNIVGIVGPNIKSDNAYEELRGYTSVLTESEQAAQAGQTAQTADLIVDFDGLVALNEDIIAWVHVPGTRIDYPVTQTDDNDYYLNHSALRAENRNGAVFMDTLNRPDFSDTNTILYGHNMQSGAMFADLHRFEDQAFFGGHPYFYVYTPDGKVRAYEIFSAAEVTDAGSATAATQEEAKELSKGSGGVYMIDFSDDAAFGQYVADILQGSIQKRDAAAPGAGDTLVTLSTCVQPGSPMRYVVQGRLAEERDVIR